MLMVVLFYLTMDHLERSFSPEQEVTRRLERLLIRASEEKIPVELETKVLNIDPAEIIASITAQGGELIAPEQLLVDSRYKRSGDKESLPASLVLSVNDFEGSDENIIHLFQALMTLGLNIRHINGDRITVEPFQDSAALPKRNVRLREEKGGVSLTVKTETKKRKHLAEREEIPVTVTNRPAIEAFLTALKYTRKSVREKRNTKYSLDGAVVEIRQAPYVRPLIEIEGMSEEEINRTLKVLGFKKKDASSLGDSEFLKEALPEEHQEKINNLRFSLLNL